MTSYFVLVASDVDHDDAVEGVSAYQVAVERLRVGSWPIYPRTRNRSAIRVGDRCLIYIGGKGPNSQSIVGSAEVASLEPRRLWTEPARSDIVESVAYTVQLKNQFSFDHPIQIRPLLSQLSFVANTRNWGGAFQGGCRKIQEKDYNLLSGTSAVT